MLATGVVAPIVLFAVAMASYGFAASTPDTTETGEMAALPWRTYRADCMAQAKRKDAPFTTPEWLDRQMPLVVALGLGQAFNPLLKTASASGYAPAWLGWPSDDEAQWISSLLERIPYLRPLGTVAAVVARELRRAAAVGGGHF